MKEDPRSDFFFVSITHIWQWNWLKEKLLISLTRSYQSTIRNDQDVEKNAEGTQQQIEYSGEWALIQEKDISGKKYEEYEGLNRFGAFSKNNL